ncbi:MAG: sugar porter family MFS transporter [Acetobacteraceae bacterium]|jgi:MFS transporter, SP family, galactose:H+ symporter
MQFVLISITAALGGLLFGYDTGVISSALLFVRSVFHLSTAGQSLVAGIVLVGAVLGAIMAGTLSDRFGRRPVILVTALVFVIGALLSAAATAVWILLVGRLLIGVAIGVASMLTPLYLAEISPAASRGAVTSLNQLCITLGILVSYLVGYAFAETAEGWRWMLGLGAVPGAILAAGMLVLPESPRWLAGHNRMPQAEAVLRRLRVSAEDVATELATLRTDLMREGGRLVPWSALLAPGMRPALIVGVGLAMFQQVTGINTVIYFAPQIFQAAGLSSASVSILATAGVGAVNVALTIVSMRLIDRVGRRVLLLWSLGGMAATLLILAGGFAFGASGSTSWITVLSVAAYVAFFAVGLGPVFWLLIAEIFPLALRGRAMSLATISNWGFNLVVTITFLGLINLSGRVGTFLLYAALTLVAVVFTAVLVPETKGRSLEEIEEALEGRRQAVPVAVTSDTRRAA